jgi:hypothetical protein
VITASNPFSVTIAAWGLGVIPGLAYEKPLVRSLRRGAFGLERVTGIEPALSAWEADVLPLNYTRGRASLYPMTPERGCAAPQRVDRHNAFTPWEVDGRRRDARLVENAAGRKGSARPDRAHRARVRVQRRCRRELGAGQPVRAGSRGKATAGACHVWVIGGKLLANGNALPVKP